MKYNNLKKREIREILAVGFILLIEMGFVPVHKFVNTTCGVNEFHLTGIKWMGGS